MSSKKSVRTGEPVRDKDLWETRMGFRVRFIPAGVELRIRATITSPLKGRNTVNRNSTTVGSVGIMALFDEDVPLTLTKPVPWPMRPSDVQRMS